MRMTYSEFLSWCEYRSKYGTLHIGMRIDRAIARHICVYLNSLSRNRRFKPEEFSPYDQHKSSTDVDDPEAVFDLLKGLSNGVTRDTNT
jgi:hypothetical protein